MSSQVRSHFISASTAQDETLDTTRLPIPMEVEVRKLTAKQIARLLDEENVGEFEPWQVFNLPYNITR